MFDRGLNEFIVSSKIDFEINVNFVSEFQLIAPAAVVEEERGMSKRNSFAFSCCMIACSLVHLLLVFVLLQQLQVTGSAASGNSHRRSAPLDLSFALQQRAALDCAFSLNWLAQCHSRAVLLFCTVSFACFLFLRAAAAAAAAAAHARVSIDLDSMMLDSRFSKSICIHLSFVNDWKRVVCKLTGKTTRTVLTVILRGHSIDLN